MHAHVCEHFTLPPDRSLRGASEIHGLEMKKRPRYRESTRDRLLSWLRNINDLAVKSLRIVPPRERLQKQAKTALEMLAFPRSARL